MAGSTTGARSAFSQVLLMGRAGVWSSGHPQVTRSPESSQASDYIDYMGMDQYLLIPFLGEWTSIYQLFWCSPGVQGFDTLPYIYICICMENYGKSPFLMDKSTINDRMEYSKYMLYSRKNTRIFHQICFFWLYWMGIFTEIISSLFISLSSTFHHRFCRLFPIGATQCLIGGFNPIWLVVNHG